MRRWRRNKKWQNIFFFGKGNVYDEKKECSRPQNLYLPHATLKNPTTQAAIAPVWERDLFLIPRTDMSVAVIDARVILLTENGCMISNCVLFRLRKWILMFFKWRTLLRIRSLVIRKFFELPFVIFGIESWSVYSLELQTIQKRAI